MLALIKEKSNKWSSSIKGINWRSLRVGGAKNKKVLSLRVYKWKRKLGLFPKSKKVGYVAKGIFALLLLMGCVVAFTGCAPRISMENDMRNVEQRDYATVLLVTSGEGDEDYRFSLGIAQEKKKGESGQREELVTLLTDDLEELYEEYWRVKGKSLSLVHLKMVLISDTEDLSQDDFWDFIEELKENRDIAKTCPVVQVKDVEGFLKYMKDAKEPVGTYLGNLAKINQEEGKSIPTVKDYLKWMWEGSDLQEYYLDEVEEGFVLKPVR